MAYIDVLLLAYTIQIRNLLIIRHLITILIRPSATWT